MGTSNVMRALALATVCLVQFAPLVVRAQSSEPEEIVVTVNGGGAIHLNEEAITAADVSSRLADLFAARGNVTIFVRADPDLAFEPVAQLIDAARGAGLKKVALMKR